MAAIYIYEDLDYTLSLVSDSVKLDFWYLCTCKHMCVVYVCQMPSEMHLLARRHVILDNDELLTVLKAVYNVYSVW